MKKITQKDAHDKFFVKPYPLPKARAAHGDDPSGGDTSANFYGARMFSSSRPLMTRLTVTSLLFSAVIAASPLFADEPVATPDHATSQPAVRGERRGMRGGPREGGPDAKPSSPADAKADKPAGGPGGGENAAESAKPAISHDVLTTADGKKLGYLATAAFMHLNEESGKPRATMFYTSYTLDGPDAPAAVPTTESASQPATSDAPVTRRPLTFVFNGGPGAASVWLHIGAVGPRKIDVLPDGTGVVMPPHVINNTDSWLPTTDLVFIDPVNTGFSRAATPDQAHEFLGVREDLNSFAEFIRLYLTKNNRWGSPIFLAGESYGTTRAAGLSNILQERTGVTLSGVILMSTVINFAVLSPSESNELPYALYLPSYAAVAWYHHKVDMQKYADLDSLLKDAEAFAKGDYASALMQGDKLPADQKHAIAEKEAALIGLPINDVLNANLRIQPWRFEKQLLREADGAESEVIGRFDGRIKGFATDPSGDSQDYDPSLSNFYANYTAAFNQYVRGTLHVESELPYEVLSGRVNPWNWKSGIPGDNGGFLYVADDLRNAMTNNPHLKLLVASGHFDLATPYFATDYQIAHLGLAAPLRKNITQTYYAGGHMMYHVKPALDQLSKDVQTFIGDAIKQ